MTLCGKSNRTNKETLGAVEVMVVAMTVVVAIEDVGVVKVAEVAEEGEVEAEFFDPSFLSHECTYT